METHIAVFAFPFGSHATPLLALVQRLAKAAPNVRFSFFNITKSNQNLFSPATALHGYDNIKPYNVFDGFPQGHVSSANPIEAVEFFIKATPGNFKRRLEEVIEETGVKVTCLLTDAFFGFSCDIAEEMGVPWVAFWTAGPCAISVHMYTDVIRSRIRSTGKAEDVDQTLEFLPGMSAIHSHDLPEEVPYENLDSPFSALLHNMGQKVPRAAAVVLNSFEEIDPTITNDLKSKLQKALNVGPSNLASPPLSFSDESGCIPWLDKQEATSVAYLSFGTVLTPPPAELVALAEALEAKKVPFLWSCRDSSKQDVIKGFLERTSTLGKVVPWCPQRQVLLHPSVGVFITHCGWNSVTESIAGGVPLICRPFFGDQNLNRRMIEDVWQIGASVEGGTFTKSGTMNALDFILSKENGKKMRHRIGVLKETATKAVGTNGSSTENFKTLLQVVTA